MEISHINPLIIGDLEIKVPIIQGGMGVKVSTAPLAAAVANFGGAGTIASVGLAYGIDEKGRELAEASNEALQKEIRKAREMSKGVIGVNIMVALSNYEDLVRTAAAENVDFIVSGAGMPLSLPEFTKGTQVKLIPIVSSERAATSRPWSEQTSEAITPSPPPPVIIATLLPLGRGRFIKDAARIPASSIV